MDRPAVIRKTEQDLRVAPHLADYEGIRRGYSWAGARQALAGLPGGALNIAYEAVDRHAQGPLRERIALRFVASEAPAIEISFAELARLTSRFANVLRQLGVQKGERLFVLAGRIPELYVAVLGSLKCGVVVTPLFSAFGPEPIATRVNLGEGKVLVTTDTLYRRKVKAWRERMPSLRHVLLISDDGTPTQEPDTVDLAGLMANASDDSPPRRHRPTMYHCCTSPAAPPAPRRARSMSTQRWSRTMPPDVSRSTCTMATGTGAPPIRDG